MGSNLMDEIDSENLFDQIDDLIDFPSDNGSAKDSYLISSNVCNDFPNFWNDTLLIHDATASDLSADVSLPYEDIAQLEWLSTFVEESFSGGGMTLEKEKLGIYKNDPPPHKYQFQTSSPDSVLESNNSNNNTLPQRARSKRPRPATFNPRAAIKTPKFILSLKSENKRKKFEVTSSREGSVDTNGNQEVRKCMHCGITKTPQWRAGPMGPKTLCNACGVRHKSGRLFPEYRPAASPTFVPALHSNAHKKVVELRNKIAAEVTKNLGIVAKPDGVD